MDDTCPYCDEDLYEFLSELDTDTIADIKEIDCPKCKKIMSVTVDWEPYFYLYKKEGDENEK